MIRSTACWTIGRYANFFVSDEDLLQPVLDGILLACIDRTKKVQEAAIVALGLLLSEGGEVLSTYLAKILATIAAAFTKYQAKNMLSLFDTVACLAGECHDNARVRWLCAENSRFVVVVCVSAEAMGSELQAPEHSHALLAPLVARWNTASDDDELLFLPLVECMVFVAGALGPTFAPFAPEVYKR